MSARDAQSAMRPDRDTEPVLKVAVEVPGAAQMRERGARLARLLRAGDLIVLSGRLGAGKTTLVQGIGEGLRVRGPITSPTFVIARTHPSLRGGPDLIHADAYRLGNRMEVDDLDLDADLDHCVTVVEWGEGLVESLAPGYLLIVIDRPAQAAGHGEVGSGDAGNGEAGDEPRHLTAAAYGERWRGAASPLLAALGGS